MNKMKTLTLQGTTFEVVDEAARNEIAEVKNTADTNAEGIANLAEAIENLPKNEPVQPDWNQNDENAPDYVKNRTHYEETAVVNEPLNIIWDGNTEGLVSCGDMFYKVSDLILTEEQIKSVNAYSNQGHALSGETNYTKLNDNISLVNSGELGIVFVNADNVEFNEISFPEPGIYSTSIEGYYIASITTTELVEHTKTVVHKLDKKYLPDDIGVPDIKIWREDDDTYHSNITFEEAHTLPAGLLKSAITYYDYKDMMTEVGVGKAVESLSMQSTMQLGTHICMKITHLYANSSFVVEEKPLYLIWHGSGEITELTLTLPTPI